MTLPNRMLEYRRSFFGKSADAARNAASEWLSDFNAHGPFEIHEISTADDGSRFIATVAYSEAVIGIEPRKKSEEYDPAKPCNEDRSVVQFAIAQFRQIASEVYLRSSEIVSALHFLVASATASDESLEKANDLEGIFDFDEAGLWNPLGRPKEDSG